MDFFVDRPNASRCNGSMKKASALIFVTFTSCIAMAKNSHCPQVVLDRLKKELPEQSSIKGKIRCISGDYDSNGSNDFLSYYYFKKGSTIYDKFTVFLFEKDSISSFENLKNAEDPPENVMSSDLQKMKCPKTDFQGTGFISPSEGGRPYHLYFWSSKEKRLIYKPLHCGCWEDCD